MPATLPTTTVEVSFTASPFDSFTLDDPVRGVLDNPDFTLGGEVFDDITDDVLSVGVTRGKSRTLDHFTAGRARVQLQNRTREYDPLNTAGPRFGEITTQREVRIRTAGSAVFLGQIDDWSFDYALNRDSIATMFVVDALATFAAQTLGTAFAPVEELTGARINAVLNRPEVAWPSDKRSIDDGFALLAAAASIAPNTNVLNYLQSVETSEPGEFFVDAAGDVAFVERNQVPDASTFAFTDTGSAAGVPYVGIQVDLSSELLYNQISVTREGGVTQIVNDFPSQAKFGVQSLVINDALLASDSQSFDLANYLLGFYKNPLVRVQRVEVELAGLTTLQQERVLSLDLGEITQVIFTPNGIGDAISLQVKVIGINHSIGLNSHRVVFETDSTATSLFILDDVVFGRLDSGVLGF
jgi:hypothetical protein